MISIEEVHRLLRLLDAQKLPSSPVTTSSLVQSPHSARSCLSYQVGSSQRWSYLQSLE
jgi:hypothetical protein